VVEVESRGPRVVLDAEHWIAFIPYAARWPLEVHMVPQAPRGRLRGDVSCRTRRARAQLPARSERRRSSVRQPHALHRRLASGADQARSRHRTAPSAAHLAAPSGGQAEVPRRLGGGYAGLGRRRRTGGGCGQAPRCAGVNAAAASRRVFWAPPGHSASAASGRIPPPPRPAACPNSCKIGVTGVRSGTSAGSAGVRRTSAQQSAPGSAVSTARGSRAARCATTCPSSTWQVVGCGRLGLGTV